MRDTSRRTRRERTNQGTFTSKMELPGPLRLLTHPKVFVTLGLIFGAGIIFSLFAGFSSGTSSSTGAGTGPPKAMNEVPDAPPADAATTDANATPSASPTATPAPLKRYTAAPPITIDKSKQYTAMIKTSKGDIQMQLYADQAPEAVNAFVFLAKDGYYNGTPFMNLVAEKNPDGTPFEIGAGDPTRTGTGSPGFSVKKELTNRPFAKGAVGMGGSTQDSNGGQFFITLGDYPALNGKYTIFGQVTSGLDVLQKLSLLDVSSGKSGSGGIGDLIQSVTITES